MFSKNQLPLRSLAIGVTATTLTVALSAAAVLAVFKIGGPFPLTVSQVTTQKQSSFEVFGESEITAIPDEAVINLGVNAQDTTVERTQSKANETTNNIIAALKAMNIADADIKTTNYSIYPRYDYTSSTQRIVGYAISTTVQVNLKDIALVNEAIDAGTANGANNVGGVNFTFSQETMKELTKQAREEAIAEAKTNAEELAALSGMRLGKIINISENQFDSFQPMYMARQAMPIMAEGAAADQTQIEPGSNTMSYSVYLSYETL